jgi:3-oxoacyl-[acyl-carrier-protein] synthase-3
LPHLVEQFLHEAGVVPADVAHFRPHQANGVLRDEVMAPNPACPGPPCTGH